MATSVPSSRLSLSGIFWIFFKAGLAFGGGLSILASLEEELVRRRSIVTREDFLTTYSLGRIVPSGTMTALAVAFGYRLGGWSGTVAALLGLTLPGFASTVTLIAGYTALKNTRLFALLPVTILPAALALVAAAAANLSRTVATRAPELTIAGVALLASVVFRVNPSILLLLGGAVGAFLLRPRGGEDQ